MSGAPLEAQGRLYDVGEPGNEAPARRRAASGRYTGWAGRWDIAGAEPRKIGQGERTQEKPKNRPEGRPLREQEAGGR